MSAVKIKCCPTCGSARIKRVCRDVTIQVGSSHFVTPQVKFDDCPNCGEQIFDLTAMEKISSHRPSFGAKGRKRAIA
jgi:YgiT-type zinc finger domain-containing protein